MKKITILRKWSNPEITIDVSDTGIGIEMSLDAFLIALVDEVAEPLVESIAASAGNPSLLFTKAALTKHLINAIEGSNAQQCFTEAANTVLSVVKQESSKVI